MRVLLLSLLLSLLLAAAAALITVNWGTYIYGVNSHHVVETSLGYFINPLVSVLLGVVVFSERLRPLQWTAVAINAFNRVSVLSRHRVRPRAAAPEAHPPGERAADEPAPDAPRTPSTVAGGTA